MLWDGWDDPGMISRRNPRITQKSRKREMVYILVYTSAGLYIDPYIYIYMQKIIICRSICPGSILFY